MKKYVVFAALISVFFALPVRAQYLEKMEVSIDQTLGVFATYSAGTQTIHWSGGQDGWIATDDAVVYFSDLGDTQSVALNATFSGMTNNSSGGQAKASFSSGIWDLNVDIDGTNVISLVGHILGNYNETEITSNKLDGRAVVVIDSATFNNDFWETTGVGAISMTDTLAGMIAAISLPQSPAFDSYTQNYTSSNVIVTLYADESVVPEPATIALLAIGGLLLRRKRS